MIQAQPRRCSARCRRTGCHYRCFTEEGAVRILGFTWAWVRAQGCTWLASRHACDTTFINAASIAIFLNDCYLPCSSDSSPARIFKPHQAGLTMCSTGSVHLGCRAEMRPALAKPVCPNRPCRPAPETTRLASSGAISSFFNSMIESI
jgi:hypothetical protein